MAKRKSKRLENGHRKNTGLSKKQGSFEHYRLEYTGLDKVRKKTLFTVSMFLMLCMTVALSVAHFLK